MQKGGETFATFYLGYYTLIQSSFDVDDAFTSCLISFSQEEELRRKTFASLLRRKKREEKRSQHLYLSLVVDLSLTRVSGRRVCVCLSVVSEKEKERKREIFDPQTTKAR
jgi:hypothetical protein